MVVANVTINMINLGEIVWILQKAPSNQAVYSQVFIYSEISFPELDLVVSIFIQFASKDSTRFCVSNLSMIANLVIFGQLGYVNPAPFHHYHKYRAQSL